MNYKKILFTITIVFCVVIECGTVHAMDGAIEPTFKSLEGVPCWSLNRLSLNRYHFSEERKQKIRQQLYESGEEKFLVLFNVATMLPPELQKIIVSDVCNGKSEDIKIFFGKPMGDVVDTYDWSYQVFRGEIFPKVKKIAANSFNWTPATIFEYSKDIAVFDLWRNNQMQCQDRKVLQSVGIVYEKIFSQQARARVDHYSITYAYRDSYSLGNFRNHQSRWQWILLPVVLFPFGVKLLAKHLYPDLSIEAIEKLAREYKAQEIMNAELRDKFETTQDDAWLSLLSTKFPNPDEQYQRCMIENRALVSTLCYFVPNSIITLGTGAISGCMTYEFVDKFKWRDSYRLASAIAVYFVTGLSAFCGVCYWADYLDDIIERPVFGIACATGCYAAVVSLWNVIKMRSTREDRVSIGKLSQLLQRSDIEII